MARDTAHVVRVTVVVATLGLVGVLPHGNEVHGSIAAATCSRNVGSVPHPLPQQVQCLVMLVAVVAGCARLGKIGAPVHLYNLLAIFVDLYRLRAAPGLLVVPPCRQQLQDARAVEVEFPGTRHGHLNLLRLLLLMSILVLLLLRRLHCGVHLVVENEDACAQVFVSFTPGWPADDRFGMVPLPLRLLRLGVLAVDVAAAVWPVREEVAVLGVGAPLLAMPPAVLLAPLGPLQVRGVREPCSRAVKAPRSQQAVGNQQAPHRQGPRPRHRHGHARPSSGGPRL
mmetsp:Transcript_61852/g.164445  ORF Transcript_61852/g.164445 Transcript_61852/m.164445 type:complete len:283 (-) Transcript_61852:44-892(-)